MPTYQPNPRADATIISGYRDPSDLNATDVIDDVDGLYWVQPDAAPFQVYIKTLRGKRVVESLPFYFNERGQEPRSATIVSDGTTTLTFNTGEGSRFVEDDVLYNPTTGERVIVTTAAATSPTVTRALGGGTYAAMSAGQKVYKVATIASDGDEIGSMISVSSSAVYNYTEVHRVAFGWTGRDLMTALHSGNDRDEIAKSKMIEFRKNLEMSLLFGARDASSVTGKTLSGGLEYFIGAGNTFNLGGVPLEEDDFIDFLGESMRWGEGGFQNGSGKKTLLASNRVLQNIDRWARDRIDTVSGEEMYGLTLKKFKCTHGDVMLIHLPILDEVDQGRAYLVDPNHMRYVYYKGRDIKLLKNRESNSKDGEAWEWFADCGLEVAIPEAHAILTNVGR